jgi:hypothetical protein
MLFVMLAAKAAPPASETPAAIAMAKPDSLDTVRVGARRRSRDRLGLK